LIYLMKSLKKKLISFFFFLAVSTCYAQQSTIVSLEPLDFGILQQVVSVSNSATALPTTALAGRKSIAVKNLGSTVVYLGSSTVTADTTSTGGFQLTQDDVFQADIGENTILYGITSSGTSNVCIIEVR